MRIESLSQLPGIKPIEPQVPTIDLMPYWHWMRRYGDLLISSTGLLVIVLLIVFADYVTAHDPTAAMNLRGRFLPPAWEAGGSWEHILGTDNLGRDIFSRTLHGGRISLQVALIAGTLSTLIGLVFGLISGYFGGMVDRIMVRITDIWLAFPFLVLALAIIAAVGNSTTILIILLTLAGWVHPARVTRAQTLRIREFEYVQASSAIGGNSLHIIRHHILPNVVSVNVVMWTFAVGTIIVVEGGLSFLGVGVNPPTPSWGNMLSDGRNYLQDAWWISVFPGMALMLTVLCINTLGDALQRLHSHMTTC